MEDTVRRLKTILGGEGLEATAHDFRFTVPGKDRALLQITVEGKHQRLLASLLDASGQTRTRLDVAPINRVTEDTARPGRVTLHVGTLEINIETKPDLAIDVTCAPMS